MHKMVIFCFIVIIGVVCAEGCSNDAENWAVIEADAVQLYNSFLKDGDMNRVPFEHWPTSIREYGPKYVRPHMFGLILVTAENRDYLRGAYIVCDPTGMPPEGGSGTHYTRIRERVFLAEVKKR